MYTLIINYVQLTSTTV